MEFYTFWNSPWFQRFVWAMDQSNWLIAKKKVGFVRHPQLINMKQNKYPNKIITKNPV
jgi:hypothetical protein